MLCALGLVVLGPKRLPEVALKIGNYLGKARNMVHSFTRQMRQEVELTPSRPMSPKDNQTKDSEDK